VGQEIVADTSPGSETKEKKDNRLQVQRTLSIGQIYEKVKDYDLVFTAEAAMMSALNDRLERPVLDHFAVTPMIYTFSKFQNEKLLQERGLFIELVNSTDLTWKQSSYLLENVLDCWKNTGSPENIKNYDRFDSSSVEKVLKIIESEQNVFKAMEEVEISKNKDVAVVNFHQFNEIDKQVLPEEFDKFQIFEEDKKEVNEFKVFNSTTEIVRAVIDNISKEIAQDTAIVLKQDSSYSTLIESALQSKGIPLMRQDDLADDEDLRTFIQVLRLSVNNNRKLIKDCQPVLRKLGFDVSVKKDNDYLSEIDSDNDVQKFRELLEEVGNSKVEEALDKLRSYFETSLETDFEELGVLDQKVSEELIRKLEYYLDTYSVEKDSNGAGVLLANSNSSAIVDRPIVFYLGMDSSWTPSIPNRPWTDKEKEDETNLRNFKSLIQNGEQQHYLVQDKSMNEEITPCLYFNELTDQEFESFTGLPHKVYQADSEDYGEGFEKEEYNVEVEEVQLFSQSSLNSFVKSPKDYLFGKVADSADQDYFRKGTLYHDFAEFYANHTDFVKKQGIDNFIQIMMDEMLSIVDELELETLETEFKIGIKNIINFVDQEIEEKTDLEGYDQRDSKENFFAEYFGKEIEKQFTEAWFENPELGVKGIADLIVNKNHLADYKSGKKKTANNIVKSSNLELVEDEPNFQAILYLAQLRTVRPQEKLKFTFFHFLDNIDDEISGEAQIEDNIVTINYYPVDFNDFVQTEEMFNKIMLYKGEKVKESNKRRKTLEVRASYEQYKDFFETRSVACQFDEDKIQESELAEEFIQYYKNEVGDYNYVEDGCKDALKNIVKFRKKNYFKEDIDAFEEFLQKQIQLLNKYRNKEFPIQNPEIRDIELEDLDNRDMIIK